MRNIRYALLILALAAPQAFSQEFVQPEPAPNHILYTSTRRTFSCEVPKNWQAFEEETMTGSAAHFMGPSEADGAFRAALNIHFVQKGSPGFVPLEDAVKREKQSDKDTSRDSSSVQFWRVSRNQARRFEVVETRQLPREVLPSRPMVLHHYYVFVNASDGYFMIKLSSTRETYLNYKADLERLLSTFQILGYQ